MAPDQVAVPAPASIPAGLAALAAETPPFANPFVLPVVLTGFQIYHRPVAIGPGSPLMQSVEVTGDLWLHYRDGVFEAHYAALSWPVTARHAGLEDRGVEAGLRAVAFQPSNCLE